MSKFILHSKKIVLCALVILLGAVPCFARAESTSILYGSWDGNTTRHAGSVVQFQVVDASGISFDLSGYQSFRFQVDGGSPREVSSGWYKLPAGTHEITLFTESIGDRGGGVTFNSAEIYEGSYLPSEKEQYLFIGDSLWEGTNALGPMDGQDSFINSIPFQLSQDMNAVPITVAAPGSGMFMSECFGPIEDMYNQYDVNADPTKIFLSIGTNDLKLGVTEDMEYEALQRFVDFLRGRYPAAAIYIVVPFYMQCYSGAIHRLTGVTPIETFGWPMVYTDGFHPDAASAKYAADMIAAMLR